MTDMQSDETWGERMAKQLSNGIEMYRRGRSDQWIADQATALGHPMSRTAISEYRRGKRKVVPITDLLALAAALEVAPIELLFPTYPIEEVEYLPGIKAEGSTVVGWFIGEKKLDGQSITNGQSRIRGLVARRNSWQHSIDLMGLSNRFSVNGEEDKAIWLDNLAQKSIDESQKADEEIKKFYADKRSPGSQEQPKDAP